MISDMMTETGITKQVGWDEVRRIDANSCFSYVASCEHSSVIEASWIPVLYPSSKCFKTRKLGWYTWQIVCIVHFGVYLSVVLS